MSERLTDQQAAALERFSAEADADYEHGEYCGQCNADWHVQRHNESCPRVAARVALVELKALRARLAGSAAPSPAIDKAWLQEKYDDARRNQRTAHDDEMSDHWESQADAYGNVLAHLEAQPASEASPAAPSGETPQTITSGNSADIGTYDGRLDHATALCKELAHGTNGNVPIQSVYEAMLKLIGREDVIAAIEQDYKRLADTPSSSDTET